MEKYDFLSWLRPSSSILALGTPGSSPFYSLVHQFIPSLVEAALNAESLHVRQTAVHLLKDLCAKQGILFFASKFICYV